MHSFTVDIKNQVQDEIADTCSIDTQVEQSVDEKMIDTVFMPTASAPGQGTCIHQSRSITKG